MKILHICVSLAGAVLIASTTPALAWNPLGALDDAIFSVKCSAADDKEACKAKAKQEADDYARNKRGEGTSSATAGGGVASTDDFRERCEVAKISGPANVDVAYNRAMDSLEVTTPEQLRGAPAHPGYKHTRVPGVRYEFTAGARIPKYEDVRLSIVSLVLKAREGGGGTNLDAEYCLGTSSRHPNPHFDNAAFWADAAATFRKLVQ
jgi:hypothetical protein